jgi:hypothetical protein
MSMIERMVGKEGICQQRRSSHVTLTLRLDARSLVESEVWGEEVDLLDGDEGGHGENC